MITLAMFLVLVGCQKDEASPQSNRPEAPKPEEAAPIRVHKDVTGQLYRYFPSDGGRPKASTTIEGVPPSARDMVMVVPAEVDPPPGLVYVADLTTEGPDGTYSYKVVSNADLDTALSTNKNYLKLLFTDSTNGLANRVEEYLESVSGIEGTLVAHEENIKKESTRIDDQIESMEEQVQVNRQRQIDGFIAMETAQAQINQQMQFLSARFG